jgi:hypothetical protein
MQFYSANIETLGSYNVFVNATECVDKEHLSDGNDIVKNVQNSVGINFGLVRVCGGNRNVLFHY